MGVFTKSRLRGPRSVDIPRAQSVSATRTSKRSLQILGQGIAKEDYEHLDIARPKTRADCESSIRPCPFVGCKYSLFLDVDELSGTVKFNHPSKDPTDIDPDQSCALDVADRGGVTLEDAGLLTNITRERIRQIEAKALSQIRNRTSKKVLEGLRGGMIKPEGDWTDVERSGNRSIDIVSAEDMKKLRSGEEQSEAPEEARGPTWRSLDVADNERCVNALFNMYLKDSRNNGFGGVVYDEQFKKRLEQTMEKIDQRTRIIDAFQNLSKGGYIPTTMEIADAAGLEGSTASKAISVARTISFARKGGELSKDATLRRVPRAPRTASGVSASPSSPASAPSTKPKLRIVKGERSAFKDPIGKTPYVPTKKDGEALIKELQSARARVQARIDRAKDALAGIDHTIKTVESFL